MREHFFSCLTAVHTSSMMGIDITGQESFNMIAPIGHLSSHRFYYLPPSSDILHGKSRETRERLGKCPR